MEAEERKEQQHGQEQEAEQWLEARSLLVLYGTETGHSQEIAEEIGEVAERMRFRTSVEQMNGVSLKDLVQYSLAVFVTSTTGQGDMPASANAFWKSLLRKKLPPGCLGQLHFTIFGLGDSSYPKFNWAARKLQKRLLQLGASEVYPAGEGDEKHDNGIDSIYLPWFQGLRSHISKEYALPNDILPIPDDELLPPKYPIRVADMGPNDFKHPAASRDRWAANREEHAALSHIHQPKPDDQELDDQELRRNDLQGFGEIVRDSASTFDRMTLDGYIKPDRDNILKDHAHYYDLKRATDRGDEPPKMHLPIPYSIDCKVLSNKRVTPESHWQDVRRIALDMRQDPDGSRLPMLRPGDSIMIYPKNFPADVQKLIDLMGWEPIADRKIVWGTRSAAFRRPRGLFVFDNASLRDLLLHNLDFNAIPNRTLLKQLRVHTRDEREKERLLELTLESNTQEFYDYTSRPRRTILEVLEDFPGVRIPIEYALETFPVIRPRAFSIANSDWEHQDEKAQTRRVELLVALVEYKTIIRKPRQGLCSRYIKTLRPGTRLAVGIQRGHPPPFGDDASKRPLIAIATGTGVAPIRSLICDRYLWNDHRRGQNMLFYGCRSEHADFHFKEDWSRLPGFEVVPAFSRDPISQDDEAYLDPYAKQERSLVSPAIKLDTDPAPIGPQNTPWIRSFDYDRGKMYVQHQIRRHAHKVCDLIRRGRDHDRPAIIMICGNAGRMPTSVRLALEDALVIGGLARDNEEAKQRLQQMEIWMETW